MIRGRAPRTQPPPPPPPQLLLLLSLLLLLLSPTVRGDCGPPPDIPNARPNLGSHSKFAEQSKVTYSCNNGFKQIPEKSNTVICLENGQWSSHETFCEKTCDAPDRLSFASLKKEYLNMNFFPVGTIVEYVCRPGFRKLPSLSTKSTCLENLEWSPVAQFCKKKSCPNPKDLINGHINIPNGILFGSEITFSCDRGYRLVGVSSTFCSIVGNIVNWDDEFPMCTEIFCPDPPKINNGVIQGESDSYTYSQVVTYSCDKGFIMIGNASIYCTVSTSDVGQWNIPPPQCIEKSKVPTKKPTVNVPSTVIPSTPQKHTTIHVPNTGVLTTPQKPSTVHVPGTRVPPMSQKPTRVNVLSTRVPPMSQKPSMVNVLDTRVSPKPQKPTKVNFLNTRVPPMSQKPSIINVPGTRVSPKPQKPTKANIPSTAAPPIPQKTSTADVPAKEIPPTPQKANTADVPPTEIPTPQKANTAHVSATEIPPAPQKMNIAVVSATEVSPQEANTAHVSTAEFPPAPQTNITIVQATEASPTPQKANTDVPATEIPPKPQKTNIAVVLATEASPTTQKNYTVKSSATKPATAQMSLISTTESAQTPLITQHPTTVVNSSAVQTAQTAQTFATAKPSLTQNSPATQRPTISHFSMTKGLHTVTQRLTSAHITATQHIPVTTKMVRHPTRTSTDKGESNSGGDHFIYGHTCLITLTVLHVMLLLIG